MKAKTLKSISKTNFKRSKKWENELSKCIRCGYCYELCPLYKTFNWESDTPRGKLILTYGLITGEVKPNREIAEKLFECFYCDNCTANCSAGVPVTDIFNDIRVDLVDAGFDVVGTTTQINEDLCSVCGLCVSVCKSEALTFTEDDIGMRKVSIDKTKCKGCGLCIATCPSGVLYQQEGFGVSHEELKSRITQFIKNENKKIVAFSCNWSVFPWLQLSESPTFISTPYGIIVTMCSSRINPELVLHAFREGAWGVMVSGCPAGECDHDGNYKTRRRMLLLKNLLKQINIEPERLRIGWFSRGESAELKKALDEFNDEISKLGPIKISEIVNYW